MTNADYLRNMTDEELADFIQKSVDLEFDPYCKNKPECDVMLNANLIIPSENCKQCIVKWLRQPKGE